MGRLEQRNQCIPDGYLTCSPISERRLQVPANGTRHVFVHSRFVFGKMETDDTLRLVNQVGRIRRRTVCHSHFGHSGDPPIGDDPRKTSRASPVPDALAPSPAGVTPSADPNCRNAFPMCCIVGSTVTWLGPCDWVSDRICVSVSGVSDPIDSPSPSSSDVLSSVQFSLLFSHN